MPPLSHGKSQASFVKNLKTEISAGKPQKQALAIAYSENRKAQHMADGGQVEDDIMDHVADELFRAIETKDKGMFRDALQALVLDIQDKDQQQDEETTE